MRFFIATEGISVFCIMARLSTSLPVITIDVDLAFTDCQPKISDNCLKSKETAVKRKKYLYLSHVMRNPILTASDQLQHKQAFTVTEDG